VFVRLFSGLAAAVVVFYTLSTGLGWEYGHPVREKASEEDRQNNFRGRYPLFLGGFRGGK
jgi:hypothetical protein